MICVNYNATTRELFLNPWVVKIKTCLTSQNSLSISLNIRILLIHGLYHNSVFCNNEVTCTLNRESFD